MFSIEALGVVRVGADPRVLLFGPILEEVGAP
jgi:hypothetical protein